jgi:serine/threonine protein kinase
MSEIGEIFLNRYACLESLGRGSMGSVYRARSLDRPDQDVVVKVMLPHVAAQPRFGHLFEREVQSLASLRHPYIVRLIDSAIDARHGPCLVMELVSGITLEALLAKTRMMSVGRTGLLLGSLCHALDSAHSAGVVHLDLKPANLMIVAAGTLDESLRVMDFGLARFSSKPHITLERLAGERPSYVQGTPCYICPEQLRGDSVDARSDLYSVGVMLFEMLMGQSPFPHQDIDKILSAHVYETPPSFAAMGIRGVPPGVEQTVQICLAKYPAERPGSARELAKMYSEAIGLDIWDAAAPPELPGSAPAPVVAKPTSDEERNAIVHHFHAWMPEVIAVVKLRGFLEDKGGQVIESAPGVLRIRLGLKKAQEAPDRFGAVKSKRERPIEIEMRMEKPDAKKNVLQVTVLFRPFTDPVLLFVPDWRKRCEEIYKDLQSYLMAR